MLQPNLAGIQRPTKAQGEQARRRMAMLVPLAPDLAAAPLAPELAAAMRRARAACDALAHSDALRAPMDALIQHAASAAQRNDQGGRPTLPDRGRFLHKLSPSNASRPMRSAAFTAMDELVACAWPTMSASERKRKERAPANAVSTRDAAESLGFGAVRYDRRFKGTLGSIADNKIASRSLADVLKQYPAIVSWLKRIPNNECDCSAPTRWNSPHRAFLSCSERTRSFCAMLRPFDPDWGSCRDGCTCPYCVYPHGQWECGGFYSPQRARRKAHLRPCVDNTGSL